MKTKREREGRDWFREDMRFCVFLIFEVVKNCLWYLIKEHENNSFYIFLFFLIYEYMYSHPGS